MKETILRYLLFAEDYALDEPEMQREGDRFSNACDNFILTISTEKTEVMYQPAPRKPNQEPRVTEAVDKITYLGSPLSGDLRVDDEVNSRIAKALGRLHLGAKTQPHHQAESLPWTVYGRHIKNAYSFPNELSLQTSSHQLAGQGP